jgi:hypothetical protein
MIEPSYTESSLVMKHGSIIASWRVNGRVLNGNIHNLPATKSSEANHPQETYAYSFLGLESPSTRTLSGEEHNNKQCLLE